MNILLSFPRSGNHLVRFFIELLSETPTCGCDDNINDTPIYKNTFPESIPFNIKEEDYKKNNNIYRKFHTPPLHYKENNNKKLICLIRNPREVINHKNNRKTESFTYFKNVDFYINFPGEKKMFFYEDIIINKIQFIQELYSFLHVDNENKLNYVIENIDNLYRLSSLGSKRSWCGMNSNNNIDYHYINASIETRSKNDGYIAEKLSNEAYFFLKQKYKM